MDITFTGIFSGFRVANFLYIPIGVKQGVGLLGFLKLIKNQKFSLFSKHFWQH
jgi:hypothetical protein